MGPYKYTERRREMRFKFYSFTLDNAEGMNQSFCFIALVIVESGIVVCGSAVFLKLR